MIKVFELEPIYTYTYIISGSESTHAKEEIAFYVVPERIYNQNNPNDPNSLTQLR
jgi:hypothetical protein